MIFMPLLLWLGLQAGIVNAATSAPVNHFSASDVVYGVVPPFFGSPALAAVTKRLDFLQRQGVDVLWLSPVYETNDSGAINYSVTNYLKLRPDFGTPADLHELVAQAHARGLKVILDSVPNHTSDQHPYFKQAKKKTSLYYDFYERHADGSPAYYFDWTYLPNLNFDNLGVVKMISEAFLYWQKTFAIDGYRVDVAWGVRERAPGFWRPLIDSLRTHDPQTLMLAEAGARDSYYVQNGFDLAYDWTDKLGVWAWREAFDNPNQTGVLLKRALSANKNPSRTVRFLNNNDTGDRFLTRYGVGVLKVAAVLQHTVPGIPLVYNGDEVGAEFSPYDDPPPIKWSDPHSLKKLYRRLAELRETEEPLRMGESVDIDVQRNPRAIAYLRKSSANEWLLVVLNFGQAATLKLEGGELNLNCDPCNFEELVSKGTRTAAFKKNRLFLQMKRQEAVILRLQAY